MMDARNISGSTREPEVIPEWFFLRYRVWDDAEGAECEVDVHGRIGKEYSDDAVSASLSWDDGGLCLALTPLRDVVVTQCRLGFLKRFEADERILLNGYQSWTDTVEHRRDARMYGLTRAPAVVIRKWALDGGGDYGFAEYSGKPGKLHGFTYAVFRNGNEYELLGSLGEDDGFTCVSVDTNVDSVIVDKECSGEVLRAGEERALCRLALVRGSQEAVYDRWFELSDVHALPAPPLVGYTSWYRHYGSVSASKLLVDLQAARYALDDVDCYGFAQLFQIDDGYCIVGDWTRVRAERFPQGLVPLVKRIREAGFLPGIWMAPFLCERKSELFQKHPDWLLRDEAGKPIVTGSHWSRGYALDTLNPHVRDYVCKCLRTMTREWGFGLVKADFLYAACMVPHGGRNRGQLMSDALDLLREAVGPEVAVLACGVPLGSAFGKVEYCRIGCDVGLDWNDLPHMRMLHRERVSTKNSMANTVFRSPLDGRAFVCDPDVFFLRDDVKLSAQRKEHLLAVDAAYGGMLLTSDDMGQWDERSRALFQAALDVLRQRKGIQGSFDE